MGDFTMGDMRTNLAGLAIKNPVVVASGPWTGDAAGIQAAVDAGAGAVITETISQEEYRRCCPRIYYRDGEILSNSLYGTLSLERWESEMERIHKRDCRLFVSIRGGTPSELAYIARKAERMGADGLQLDLYSPVGTVIMGLNNNAAQLVSLVSAVKAEVSIPVLVRLPQYVSDNTHFLRSLEKSGADGLCVMESLRGILGVDIAAKCARMPTFGAYSGCHVLPVMLAAVAALSQATDLPISATGGVENWENVIEAIELGASTVQLGSAVLLHGYSTILKCVEGLEQWMTDNECEKLLSLRGAALPSLHSYDDLDSAFLTASIHPDDCCNDCNICRDSCLAGAIMHREQERPTVDADCCNGCGLCVTRCPYGCVTMEKR